MRRLGNGSRVLVAGALLVQAGLASAEGLSDAVQAGRTKVVAVNHGAGEMVSLNGVGETRVDRVGQRVLVVADGAQRTGLAFVGVGDIVKTEYRDGQIYKITVLRRAWLDLGSPE